MTAISVVAPNLDEETNLPLFFISLCNQSFKDFEVVIVDGGSKDKSLEIIRKFSLLLDVKLIVDKTRNIGYIRNVGAEHAQGKIIMETNSDTYFEPCLLQKIYDTFKNGQVTFLGGSTFPLGTSSFEYLAYHAFDCLRYLASRMPFPLKQYSPSGNLLCLKRQVFKRLGGYPLAQINEDGQFGKTIMQYCRSQATRAEFRLDLYVGHHAKRFKAKGSLKSLLFYLYVFGNLFPFLARFLKPLERKSGKTFSTRSDLKNNKATRL